MSDDEIIISIENRVAVLTLNRPDVLNAFTDTMRERLYAELQACEAATDVGCVVITGAGRAFCAGGDIDSMAKLQDADDTSVIETRINAAGDVLAQIRNMSKPVIAAINGAAAGGGMGLALGCDMRLASERALFTQSFVKIGLAPDWGSFYSLPRLVGTAKAMEIMMLGDRFGAEEAMQTGIVNRVFSEDNFMDQVMAMAKRLAESPQQAIAEIKQGVYLGTAGAPADVLALEHRVQKDLFLTQDSREGMRAFIEKRAPVFNQDS